MTSVGDEPVVLTQLAEKHVSQPIDPYQLSYCPTMDLLAVGAQDDQVHVFRLNGQRVFGAAHGRKGLRVRQLHWKPNGRDPAPEDIPFPPSLHFESC